MVDTPGCYTDIYLSSLQDAASFWLTAAQAVEWAVPPTRALDDESAPLYRWFPDGYLNTSVNALDRHVNSGRGDQPALIYDSAVGGRSRSFTYQQLLDEVSHFAGVLVSQGVVRGDRVVIYMPMVPEAVIAMLACARIGAVHSVVFGGFAAAQLAIRIDDIRPRVLVTSVGGREGQRSVPYFPQIRQALDLASYPVASVIVKQRPEMPELQTSPERWPSSWVDWDTAMSAAAPQDAVMLRATDPLYVLYTSGTTNIPKGVVRDHGGHAVAMTWSMAHIYGISPGEVMFSASDIGWVVGHSYIVYGPLMAGATTILYEGKPIGTPDAAAYWRIVQQYGVNVLFTAPTALRAIRREDRAATGVGAHDLSTLRTLFVAGERLDPSTYDWATEVLGIPVVDHWWQTETGWAICANPRGIEELPIKRGSPSVPMPGYRVTVVDGAGEILPQGEEGNIVIDLPLPPGSLSTLWGNDDRFIASYLSHFPGKYLTGDAGYLDEDGYLFVIGRTDDVINVAGHRLSVGSIEAVLATHPDVAECAVVGVPDPIKGSVPAGYIVLAAGSVIDPETLRKELVAAVREQVGPVASFTRVTMVPALPKTRSGKILRRTMRQIIAGEQYQRPATLENPEALTALAALVGYRDQA